MTTHPYHELIPLGWSQHFTDQLTDDAPTAPARVAEQHRDLYRLVDADGAFDGIVSGRFRHESTSPADFPAVGDWVLCHRAESPAVIHRVLDRRSRFSRLASGTVPYEQVIAANVDVLFLVTGLDGNYNVSRIERYATQAWNSGAVPVVILNKADLHPDPAGVAEEVSERAVGVDVHVVSAERGEGTDALRQYVGEGRTVALVGSSGVGKSTLVNCIAGEQVLATGAVREGDSRGRHTTTHRQLVRLPAGGLLIDTPGMRELGLWMDGDDDGDVEDTFSDIEALADGCRFTDCRHEAEPGCAILAARDAGELDAARLRNWHRLRGEQSRARRRKKPARNGRPDSTSKRQAKRAERRSMRQRLTEED